MPTTSPFNLSGMYEVIQHALAVNANAAARDGQDAALAQVTEYASYGLSIYTGHIGDFLMAERHAEIDRVVPALAVLQAHVQNELRNTMRSVVCDHVNERVCKDAKTRRHCSATHAC